MNGNPATEAGRPAAPQRVLVVGGTQGAAARLARDLVREGGARLAWSPWSWETAPTRDAGIWPLPAPGLCEDGVDALAVAAEAALGAIDAVVVDASGASGPGSAAVPVAVVDERLDRWQQALDRRLRAPFLVVQRMVEGFLMTGTAGRILLLTRRDDTDPALAAARTALHSFTRSVAREYGRRGIACNAVDLPAYGAVDVPADGVIAGVADDGQDQAANDPTGAAWAPVATFLISPRAAYVSGEVAAIAPPVADRVHAQEVGHGF